MSGEERARGGAGGPGAEAEAEAESRGREQRAEAESRGREQRQRQRLGPGVLSCLQWVAAPMVSQSDAPFRALCLKYGATAADTEMLYSDKIVSDPDYLDAYLPASDHVFAHPTSSSTSTSTFTSTSTYPTRPLVVQVCGNDPSTLADAVS
jgi:hypothetical protein